MFIPCNATLLRQGAFPRGAPFRCYTRVGSGINHKYKTWLGRVDSDKCSVLFSLAISDEETNKLECLSLKSFRLILSYERNLGVNLVTFFESCIVLEAMKKIFTTKK